MYQKIMVTLDGSELAECVLPHIEALAKAGVVKSVIFVRAVEPLDLSSISGEPDFSEEQIKEIDTRSVAAAKNYLDQLVNRLNYGKAEIRSEVISGRIAKSLAEYATKNEADLIIIATHGRSGVSRWVWGSIADRLLHSACVPILMIRAPGCMPGF